MSAGRWHILTGEYPPRPGGVADYTHLVAGGLASAGGEVHVWTTAAEGATPEAAGVVVHREAGRWSSAGLARLDAALGRFPAPRRLLVQYTPNAWGYKGTNLGFGRWLVRRQARGDVIWTMFHEAYYPWALRDKPTRWALAAVHRLMVREVLRASSRVYLAMAGLEDWIRPYEPGGRRPATWLPVPSNIPLVDDPPAVAALRRRLAPRGEAIVGAFSTYGDAMRPVLRRALPPVLLAGADRVGLLIGRHGARFAADMESEFPALIGRLAAPGGLDPGPASLHLQACDIMVMPYVDGVSARRGTVMAALAHGRPLATNGGHNTEPIWAGSGAVSLSGAVAGVPAAAEALLADPAARARLGASARDLYARRFAVERTVEVLLTDMAARPGDERRPAAGRMGPGPLLNEPAARN